MIEGDTRRSPGPHLRTFLIAMGSSRSSRDQASSVCNTHNVRDLTPRFNTYLRLRRLVVRRDERLLERADVLALQEQAERGIDVGVPRVAGNDSVRERSREGVGLPLRQRPLEVRAVQLRVRVLPGRDGALGRIERVLCLLAAAQAP